MNKHILAFLIKFVGTFTILYLVLGFTYGMAMTEVLLLSAVVSVSAYLIGDLFILPRTNNSVGTIADFGLAFFVIFMFSLASPSVASPFLASLLATFCFSLYELFFHRYMADYVFPDKSDVVRGRNLTYQTEAAEELDTKSILEKDRRNK